MEQICEKHDLNFVPVHGMGWTHEEPEYEGDVEHTDHEWKECPECMNEKLSTNK